MFKANFFYNKFLSYTLKQRNLHSGYKVKNLKNILYEFFREAELKTKLEKIIYYPSFQG